jgi:transcriptional regulator GlxA family with amidase domain
VVIVAFEEVQTLDATGPAEVFAAVGRRIGGPHYRVVLASTGGGPRRTSSGITVDTADLRALRPRPEDIVVVAGGQEAAIRAALADAALLRWLSRAQQVVRRLTSVCSGAFLLAAIGALDGKRATTHWAACDQLARAFPRVEVDRNAIFIEQGRVWTSAGVTTGIDMALAIVEQDLGRAVADAVAANLVLYVRRPGFQSQFSDALVAQTEAADPLGPAIAWARANLGAADVDALARRAGLSVRTLHRRCRELLGTTPAKLIDKLRVEHARALMEAGTPGDGDRRHEEERRRRGGRGGGRRGGGGGGRRAAAPAGSPGPLKTLAAHSGFGNAARMKRAFERELGIGPRDYRILHAPRRRHSR